MANDLDYNLRKTTLEVGITCLFFHAIMGLFFNYIKVMPMAYINIFSCATYICAILLVLRDKAEIGQLLGYIEIAIYSCVATMILGVETFFVLYIVDLMVNEFTYIHKKKIKTIFFRIAVISVLCIAVGLDFFVGSYFSEYRALNEPYLKIVVAVNLLVTTFTTYNYIKNFRNELISAEEKLIYIADRDTLTGLYNRTFFNKYKSKIDSNYSILLMDLDNFKSVNDTYGHDVGDKALIYLAKQCESVIGQDDICVRWGGEEFIIAMPDCSLEDAKKIAEEVRQKVESSKVDEKSGLSITVTIGVAQGEKPEEIEKVIKHADELLYYGKESGKNMVVS